MQKYSEAKARNQVVTTFSSSYLSPTMQKRAKECGNWLSFITDWELTKQRLNAANFCNWRFCPMCAWRKARRDAQKISVMMAHIAQEHKKSFIFVTLTAPNVKVDELPDAVAKFNAAFFKLIYRKDISGMNHGFIRKLEVTYNPERDDYHPHFHVIFAVNPGYFSGGRYIRQSRWLDLWRSCMGDDSITQVDVRKVKQRADADTLAESFDTSEFAKYAAKDADYTRSAEVFDGFYKALKGRQLLTFGGLFAKAHAKYKNKELDEYIKTDKTSYYWEVIYTWKGAEYAEHKRRALDFSDKHFLAQRGIDTEIAD